jgi:hypothetical protein
MHRWQAILIAYLTTLLVKIAMADIPTLLALAWACLVTVIFLGAWIVCKQCFCGRR